MMHSTVSIRVTLNIYIFNLILNLWKNVISFHPISGRVGEWARCRYVDVADVDVDGVYGVLVGGWALELGAGSRARIMFNIIISQ